MRELTDQEIARRNKLNEFRERGIDPFGHRFEVKDYSNDLKDKYLNLEKEDLEKKKVTATIAGRIMTKRGKGKVGFMNLQDKFGQIQVYVRKDEIGEDMYYIFDKNDIGDIVGVEGEVMKTHTGELTIKAQKYTHLSKSIRPLPEKYHGLQDTEERFRRRYVDLIMNDDARKIAFMRPKVIRSIQNYLDEKGYTEVETPILGTILGGANARPFVTHHNTLGIDMYLRVATELNLKRLIVGGMGAVYEIGKDFRNEGMDKNHNPEFTMIELYEAYSNLEGMMDITEGIIKNAAEKVLDTMKIEYRGHKLDLAKPFKRIHMVDAVKDACGVDFYKVKDDEEAKKLAKEHNIEIEEHYKYGHIVEEFFAKYCEDNVIEPTFVYGHPTDISPLAKKDSTDERFTRRFELFIVGKEFANAFSELNDPIDQRERFEAQVAEQEMGNEEATDMDEDYVEALEYGLPPTGGMGLGIDRLVMLLSGAETIREVILFPTMKLKD